MLSGLSFSHSSIAVSGVVAGAELDADRVGDPADEVDVRAVELPGALADPQEVAGQAVGLAVGDPGQRPVVLQRQRLVRAVEADRAQRLVVGHAAGADEVERPVDLAGDRLVALAGRGGPDEVLVPVVQAVQVGQAAGEVRPEHVHRGGRVGVRPDHALRVGDPGGLGSASSELIRSPRYAGRPERVGRPTTGAWCTARRPGPP